MLQENLKYLKNQSGISQVKLAENLDINRHTWAGYEKGKSEPTVSVLQKICGYFNVNIEQIVNSDLANSKFEQKKHVPLNSENLRVLAITKNTEEKQNIELVPIHATAGYALSFSDTAFLKALQNFSLPKLNDSTYRAFEIQGKSMLPIKEGSIIVGRYVEHLRDLKNNKRYILILKEHGILFKRVFKEIETNNCLILVSDNPENQPFTIHVENILEAWEMVASIDYGDEMSDNTSLLVERINSLEQKINQFIHTKN